MKINISKEETKKAIESYYLNTYNLRGTVDITTTQTLTGYYTDEHYEATTKIVWKADQEIAGMKTKLEKEISGEEISAIFTDIFENAGYEVSSVRVDSSMEWQGYGMNEHYEPVFNGICVETKEKVNRRK